MSDKPMQRELARNVARLDRRLEAAILGAMLAGPVKPGDVMTAVVLAFPHLRTAGILAIASLDAMIAEGFVVERDGLVSTAQPGDDPHAAE